MPLGNFSRFWAATCILTVNCAEMAGSRPRQPDMKFSALNKDFSSLSPDSLDSKRPAHTVSKKGTLVKSGYLFVVVLSSVKMVADRHRHVAYHNKHWQ